MGFEPALVGLLLEHGFVYDSSLMGHDYLPYQARDGDVVDAGDAAPVRRRIRALVEMPISWSLDDHPAFEYFAQPNGMLPGLMDGAGCSTNWVDDFALHGRALRIGASSPTPSIRT